MKKDGNSRSSDNFTASCKKTDSSPKINTETNYREAAAGSFFAALLEAGASERALLRSLGLELLESLLVLFLLLQVLQISLQTRRENTGSSVLQLSSPACDSRYRFS